MSDVADTLAVLQFGDSFFPSGAVSFSWGLEGLSDNGVVTSADEVRGFVIGQLRARWAEFDRPVVVAAHRARVDLDEVSAIDAQVEMQSPCAELRSASRRMPIARGRSEAMPSGIFRRCKAICGGVPA
jgi:urease accessory protein